ncbi:MAG: ABC transporter ATP-binding protein, partial [Firmicutes bacterium]|nr:ABC transporter ATP-binding protein [Bacillota bacterium]
MARRNGTKVMAKPKDAKKTIARIMSYVKEYKFRLFLVVIGVLISTGANVSGTYFIKPIINNYVVPFIGQGEVDLSGFASTMLMLAAIYICGVLSSYAYMRIMLSISTKTLYRIRMDMFEKMQKLPIKYFDTHSHGEIMSRYTSDTDTLRDMFSQSFAQFISSAISVVSVFIMMIILSPILTVLVILMLCVILTLIRIMGKKSSGYFRNQQQNIGKVNGFLEEMIEGQKVVKVFCHEEESKAKFDLLNEDLRIAATNANTVANILMPMMSNLSHIHYAITAMVGSLLAIMGILDIGTIATFLQYTRSFFMPINQVSQQFNSLMNAIAGAERIFNLIDEEAEEDDGYVTLVNITEDENGKIRESSSHTGKWAWKHPHSDGTLTYTKVMGKVEFQDVVFSYDGKKTVLNNVSLYAKPGQKIAFVGSTGAGKTTITNLINRFYDIKEGKIRYDDINIKKIKKDDLRRSLSMVLQDTHLFTGSVADNIRFGKLDATDEEIVQAAKLANADSFIRHLPDGYDTILTADGANL